MTLKIWPCLLLSLEVIVSAAEECSQTNRTKRVSFLERLFDKMIPDDYNRQQPPFDSDVQFINVSFMYFSIPQVVFAKMEFEAEFLIHIEWKDNRLNTSLFLIDENTNGTVFPEVPEASAQEIWIPNVYFANCKSCSNEPRRRAFYNAQKMTFSSFVRETMSFACKFDLSNYPFDSHECAVSLEFMDHLPSAKFKLNDVIVEFFNQSKDGMVKWGMPSEFQFKSLRTTQTCSKRSPAFVTQTDHCLEYKITIQRIAAYHMMLVFCPTTVIVIISWISFWLPVEAAAPRVSLGLTSLLTLTTQFANEQKSLPPVAYTKALDCWMLMCVFMVFGSLVEFALATTFKCPRKKVPIVERLSDDSHKVDPQPLPEVNNPRRVNASMEAKKNTRPATYTKQSQVNWLDAKCKVAFPLFFILFNIIYWPCYAT